MQIIHLEQVEKQKNCVILTIQDIDNYVDAVRSYGGTVQKFNRIEASDQSTIQLSLEGVIIINLNVNMKRKILTEKIFYNIYI